MNPSDSENPLLTRYILDDLPVADRLEVEHWIQENPALHAEVQGLQEVAEALRTEAPLLEMRLNPAQRARILQGPPRRATPAPRAVRPAQPGLVAGFMRLAAMIALVAGAFMLGRHYMPSQESLATTDTAPSPGVDVARAAPAETAVADTASPEPAPVEETSVVMVAETAPEKVEPEVVASEKAPSQPAIAVVAEVVPEEKAIEMVVGGEQDKANTAKLAANGVTVPADAGGFTSTNRRAADQSLLQPRLLRPSVAADARQLAAKPLSAVDKTAADTAARRKPDLHIHAWSHETASCPWNPQLRLLKVTIQLPADQEAVALGSHEYPVEVAFDANNVREFRRIGTRYQPPAELRSAGSQTIWYEFRPNGAPASTFENGKLIATVRLPGARFTTQAVGPFDASRLQVLDRGREWRQARGDFLFEAAVVALSLLLDGSADGELNQQMVLDLAQAARETGDPDGSRARFIGALRQLSRLAGR